MVCGVQGVGPAMTLLQSGRVSTPTMGATCLRSLLRGVVVAGVALLTWKSTLCLSPLLQSIPKDAECSASEEML